MQNITLLKDAQFVLADLPEIFDGYETEEDRRWNGFAVPIFDEFQLVRLLTSITSQDEKLSFGAGAGLTWRIYDDSQDEIIVLEPIQLDGIDFHVYTFDGWCFHNVKDFTPEDWEERNALLAENQKQETRT